MDCTISDPVDKNEEIKIEAASCIALWRAVVYRALCDVGSGLKIEHIRRLKYGSTINMDRANAWFVEDNQKFQQVCALAHVDENEVLNRVELIRNRINKYK